VNLEKADRSPSDCGQRPLRAESIGDCSQPGGPRTSYTSGTASAVFPRSFQPRSALHAQPSACQPIVPNSASASSD